MCTYYFLLHSITLSHTLLCTSSETLAGVIGTSFPTTVWRCSGPGVTPTERKRDNSDRKKEITPTPKIMSDDKSYVRQNHTISFDYLRHNDIVLDGMQISFFVLFVLHDLQTIGAVLAAKKHIKLLMLFLH